MRIIDIKNILKRGQGKKDLKHWKWEKVLLINHLKIIITLMKKYNRSKQEILLVYEIIKKYE